MTKHQFGKSLLKSCLLIVLTILTSIFCLTTSPALAGINDDKYEGNIFILYAGNGSLVPPRLNLSESLQRKMPVILVYYVDDSSDCKQFSVVVSQLQAYYGRAASIIPVSVDTIRPKAKYTPDDVGYYYQGGVPQTVILDQKGKVVFNAQGKVAFEAMDDVLREVFDLLPRSESAELKLRSFNEYNAELTAQ